MERTGNYKFTFEAGATIRRNVVSALKNSAFTLGLEIEIDEDQGFFDSNYRVKVKGTESKLLTYKEYVEKLFRRLERER